MTQVVQAGIGRTIPANSGLMKSAWTGLGGAGLIRLVYPLRF